MTFPNTQPVLPAEAVPSNVEEYFINEQPQRLFPRNQNSNFGTVRKVITDEIQLAVETLSELFSELFVTTASGYLGLWEREVGLPDGSAALSVDDRRLRLLTRVARGPFTRTRRREVVERFIAATFGAGTDFGSSGIELTSGGVPMFSGVSSLAGTYSIVEDVEDFSYEVRILDTITVDLIGLTRELTWLTPAGISFTIVSTPAP